MAGTLENPFRDPRRWRLVVWGTAAFVLLSPAIAMRFTTEVDWGAADFLTFGVMLASACGLYEQAVRASRNTAYRAGAGLAIVAGLLLVWMNLAVGIMGSEGDPANLLFAGVLVVGAVGAALARLQAEGMARMLFAMAIAMAAPAGYALSLGSREGALLSGFYAAFWLAGAALFRQAARQRAA